MICLERSERPSDINTILRYGLFEIPLSYFSFQPVLHNWCNKGRGMCYPVCGMVHIKEALPIRVAYVAAVGFLFHYQNGP